MKKGFTFVEVLVSTIILIIVLAEMLAGFAGGRLISRRSRERLIAQGFAREKLEELLNAGYTALPITGGYAEDPSFLINYANLEFVKKTEARRFYKIDQFYDAQGRPCYKRIIVVVKWKDLFPDVIYTESLSSLIYNPDYGIGEGGVPPERLFPPETGPVIPPGI